MLGSSQIKHEEKVEKEAGDINATTTQDGGVYPSDTLVPSHSRYRSRRRTVTDTGQTERVKDGIDDNVPEDGLRPLENSNNNTYP